MNAAVSSSKASRFLRAGPIMMVLGALLTLAGIIGTTASTNGGNESCPAGTVLIAKFNYDHGYDFEKPAGNEHVVTLSHADENGATWHSSLPVSYVIVKGGVNSVLYTIAPPKSDGTFSNEGLPTVGYSHQHPDVSNVQFCGTSSVPTSTTSSSSTTSTSSTSSTSTSTTSTQPTTTTCQCQTTTTHAPVTTTTHAPVTTTTHAPVTTTCECQTTTTHHTTTTVGESTSTTAASTTTEAGSTTSSSSVSGSTIVGATTTIPTHHVTSTTRKSAALGGTTTFKPYVTSTSVLTSGGKSLPFTGSSSTPLVALGIVLLATGLTLTLSQARRRERGRV